jgi:hypothetical protein
VVRFLDDFFALAVVFFAELFWLVGAVFFFTAGAAASAHANATMRTRTDCLPDKIPYLPATKKKGRPESLPRGVRNY